MFTVFVQIIFLKRCQKAPSATSTSLEALLPMEVVTLQGGKQILLSYVRFFLQVYLNFDLNFCFYFVVTAALTAPWRPAQTTLTTAGLVLRPPSLTWGTTTRRMSMRKTTTKTNPPTARHSNERSPSNHSHHGNRISLFFRVCFLNTPSLPVPVSHACISVWLSQGCR